MEILFMIGFGILNLSILIAYIVLRENRRIRNHYKDKEMKSHKLKIQLLNKLHKN